MERIDDDYITVVEIGDADIAACGGMHVRDTEEVIALLVDRKVSAGKDGYAIHFKVGRDAIERSAELSNTCLQMVDAIGSKPEDAVMAVMNLRSENDSKTNQIRTAFDLMLKELRPVLISGIPVYAGISGFSDRTTATDHAERIREEGGVAVLMTGDDTLSVLMSSGIKEVDCSAIVKDILPRYGGRGGGKKDFAQGGVPDVSKVTEIFNDIIALVRNALKQEN
jgi:alanyl-tRNA synthetase